VLQARGTLRHELLAARARGGPAPHLAEARAQEADRPADVPARAGNRRFWLLSSLHAHTQTAYKIDLSWETRRPLNRPERARTGYRSLRAAAVSASSPVSTR
jgi:hypothetical protein